MNKNEYEFFFFQAEDGIRDIGVTGVQTCALPISAKLGIKPGTLWLESRELLVKVCANTEIIPQRNVYLMSIPCKFIRDKNSPPFCDLVAIHISTICTPS